MTQTRRAGTLPSKPFARNSLVPIYSYSTMRVKGVRLCSSVVERLTCNQEVLSSILSGGSELFCRRRRLPRRAAAGWRAGTSPRRPARSARGDARSRRSEGPVGTIDDGRNCFFCFRPACKQLPFAIFRANAIVGAKHHGTVRGAHRERVPRTGDHDGVAVDRSSPEDGRGAGDTRAGVSALRCVPHRARRSRHLRRADRRSD